MLYLLFAPIESDHEQIMLYVCEILDLGQVYVLFAFVCRRTLNEKRSLAF